ncbi:MAG: hypothetical protein ACRCSS_00040, partial [Shewanella sp.]
MQPRKHQLEIADKAVYLIANYGLAYIAAEERTGKTLAAIVAAEKLGVKQVVIVTKAKAIAGWEETIAAYKPAIQAKVISFHQAYKLIGQPAQLYIIDEAHSNLSGYPKPGKIQKEVRQLCAGKPVLFLSATPHAQGYAQLFHQLQVSSRSPFRSYSSL